MANPQVVEYKRALAETVARGIALLDEHGPEGWLEKIDPQDLNLQSTSQCVLGQVYGDFSVGLEKLLDESGREVILASAYGFDWPQADGSECEDELADEDIRVEVKLATLVDGVYGGPDVDWDDREGRVWRDLDAEWLRQLKERGVGVPT